MQHTHHVDIEEEPGTYKANFACKLAMLVGVLALAYGFSLAKSYPALAVSTMVVGALALVLNAARLWLGATRWASVVTILLGIYSWYSGHFNGVNPNVFDQTALWIVWGTIAIGIALVYLGTWGAIGAPGAVQSEPLFYWGEKEG